MDFVIIDGWWCLHGGWWCPRGGWWCPRGVLVSSVVVLGGWWWLPGAGGAPRWLVVAPWQPRPHIHSRTRRRGHATLLSAAALSLKWVPLRIFFNRLLLYLSII